jgi:mRNA-degrading endonuclease toxin of MazEF toxin-antitoxin module
VKRGSVALFREANSPASKARPCIVVQSSATLAAATKIIAVPLSSTVRQIPVARPVVVPTAANGLRQLSEAQVDWVFSFRRDRFGPIIGEIDEVTMGQIDTALRRWLAL